MASFRGWDTPEGWSDVQDVDEDIISIVVEGGGGTIHSWVEPTLYQSDTTLEKWRGITLQIIGKENDGPSINNTGAYTSTHWSVNTE